MEKKNSFVLYLNALEQWEMLSDEQAGKLVKALFKYADTGEKLQTEDGMLRMAFSFITAQMDRDSEKYAKTCEKRRNSIKKRWENNNTKNTNVYTCIQNDSNVTDNDNDNVNDNENENDNDNDTHSDTLCVCSNNIKAETAVSDSHEKPSHEKSEVFIRPSVEEVRKYCKERKNKIDPQRFVDYYDSKGWMLGKSHMKDWKAAVRCWESSSVRDAPPPDPDIEKYKCCINQF